MVWSLCTVCLRNKAIYWRAGCCKESFWKASCKQCAVEIYADAVNQTLFQLGPALTNGPKEQGIVDPDPELGGLWQLGAGCRKRVSATN